MNWSIDFKGYILSEQTWHYILFKLFSFEGPIKEQFSLMKLKGATHLSFNKK